MRLRHFGLITAALALGCGGLDEPVLDGLDPDEAAPAAAPDTPEPEAPAPVIRRPAGPLVPLAVGHRWTYEITERKGAGIRIFGFATEKPTTTTLAEHTFEITGRDGDRYTATLTRAPRSDALPSTTAMTLWEKEGQVWMDAGNGERLAIEASVPPAPVSSESVRCIAHMLGGAAGTCSPVWGGPLGTEPGLTAGVVGGHVKEGADVAQFLVGVATVGIFIPGNKSTVQRATLTEFRPAAGTQDEFAVVPVPLVATFSGDAKSSNPGPRLVKAIEKHGAEPESVAAALTLVPSRNLIDAAVAALPLLEPVDRYPVSRVAIQRADNGLSGLARIRPHLDTEIPGDQAAGLLALFEDSGERETADAVLDGDSELLISVVAAVDGPFDSDVLEALESGLAETSPKARDVPAIARMCTFDDCRVKVVQQMQPRLPAQEHTAILLEVIPMLSFDDGKLTLIRDNQAALSALPRADREALADSVAFEDEQARELLGL